MKPGQINKLYAKLTPHEQAALVLEAAARLDEKDVDAILDCVEHRCYETLHKDYHRRAYGLQWLVGQYGIDYWKNRTLMLMACNLAEEGNKQADEIVGMFFARVVAIETAIAETCKQLKVDVAAMKTMVGCPNDEQPNQLPAADDQLVQQYTEVYAIAGASWN